MSVKQPTNNYLISQALLRQPQSSILPQMPSRVPMVPMPQQVADDPMARVNLKIGQLVRDRANLASPNAINVYNLRIQELRNFVRSGGTTPIILNGSIDNLWGQ